MSVNEPEEATSKVLRVPELLEHILGFLPFRDLLLAQGVNKNFRDVVSTSNTLQKKLHLIADDKTAGVQRIPILPARDTFKSSWSSLNERDNMLEVKVRPWFAQWHLGKTLDNRFSWKRMFATQPPPKKMKTLVVFNTCTRFGHQGWEGNSGDDLVSEAGITLGQMLDRAFAEAAKFDRQFEEMSYVIFSG